MYAKVIVDVKTEHLNEAFDYYIPEEYRDIIEVGSRVFVEFGTRKLLGYVVEITEESIYPGQVKPIIEILDFARNINEEQILLAKFLENNYNALAVSCLDLMLPSFLKGKYRKYLLARNLDDLDADLALLFKGRKKVLVNDEIIKKWSKVKKAINAGLIKIDYGVSTYGVSRYTNIYTITSEGIDNLGKLTPKRNDCLDYVYRLGKVKLEDILESVGISEYIVNSLVKLGYLEIEKELIIDYDKHKHLKERKHFYNLQQQNLIYKFDELSKKPFLLQTNDFKFLKMFLEDKIVETINQEKQVLILTPTILKNNEITIYLKRNIEARIVNLNSSLPNNIYYDNYLDIKNGYVDIVVSTLVGIFSPLENIGLIIIFDEEDLQYINQTNPPFNALEVLIKRANYHQAKLIMSSLTPSVKRFYQMQMGDYYYLDYIVDLNKEVSLVNMKEEIMQTGNLIISRKLKEGLKDVLDNNKTAMLILHRDGYSTIIRCASCHNIYKCPTCQVPLTYYKRNDSMRCNLCNYSLPKISSCAKCNSREIEKFGFGLEQLQESLENIFSGSRILKVDSTYLQHQSNYEKLIEDLEDNRIDFLIGTNILNDAFRNHNISLVGLIKADISLERDDFRASEFTFREINHLVNRDNTKVIIQTYYEDHYAVTLSAINDYESFYLKELGNREILKYEPFYEINRIIVKGDFKRMYHFANYYKKVFNRIISYEGDILGPVYLPRHKGVQLIVKHNKDSRVLDLLKKTVDSFNDRGSNVIVIYEKIPRGFN